VASFARDELIFSELDKSFSVHSRVPPISFKKLSSAAATIPLPSASELLMGSLPLTFLAGSFRDCALAISRIESDPLIGEPYHAIGVFPHTDISQAEQAAQFRSVQPGTDSVMT